VSNDNADQTIEQPGWRPGAPEPRYEAPDQVIRPMAAEEMGRFGAESMPPSPPAPPMPPAAPMAAEPPESHGFFDAIKDRFSAAEQAVASEVSGVAETVKADVAGIVGEHKPEVPVAEAADAVVRPFASPVAEAGPMVAAAVVPEPPVPAPVAAEPTVPLAVPEPTVPLHAEPVDDTAIREAERAAREKMLGTVPATEDTTEVPQLVRHDNDKVVGSFGLFWLRLVAGAVIGVRAALMLIHVGRTTDWLTGLSVPYPDVIAWAAPIVLLIVAALLVIGFGTRTCGVIVALYAVALLVFVQWGPFNIFQGGPAGDFYGQFELLLAGVGIALAFLGAGGWSIDGHRRLVRAKRKLYG